MRPKSIARWYRGYFGISQNNTETDLGRGRFGQDWILDAIERLTGGNAKDRRR
jgi:hypothetical protein